MCQNIVITQSRLHPALDDAVSIGYGYYSYIFTARRVEWQKDKLVIQNHSLVRLPPADVPSSFSPETNSEICHCLCACERP